MFDSLATLFFIIGCVTSAFYISSLCFSLNGKFRESSARKQDHDKRLVTLLEAIDKKLNAKL